MNKLKLVMIFLGLSSFILLLTGCFPKTPVEGANTPMFCHWKVPLTTNMNNVELGSKQGKSTAVSILDLWTDGSMSVADAAKKAGINKIKFVEYEYDNKFFFMYQKATVIVYGD